VATAPPDTNKTPWDARLVERMSRSSSAATRGRPLSPIGFFFLALFYSVLAAAWGHDIWYGVAWFAVLVAIRQLAELVRGRRSHGGRR
jgi:hypothetical protein